MKLAPTKGGIGVELIDTDLTKPLSRADIHEVRNVLAAYHLILTRGQKLHVNSQDRFVTHLGPLQQS
ncbi:MULTISPECIES: hypothetical protein [Actinomycetes]|uniref:hypothetical protein n=1 Tax=Actinomycetes TaxID=1760 RepID=UPI0004BEBD44|nr:MULTISPECIES: hypothetical protein [Actinomycetes]